MKAWELLHATYTPDGTGIRLTRRDDEYMILANGKPLMSSRIHGSEEALATLGCGHARGLKCPRVLVGGLGMGFTLRAVLDVLPSTASVTVTELVPAVIEWNRASLGSLAGHPLRDHRVRIEGGDVGFTLCANPGRFDVVLLDVDNGPAAFTSANNAGLYDDHGVAAAHAALRPDGTLAVWSAFEDRDFEQRLRSQGFHVDVARVRARLKKGGPRHTLFLAHKRPSRAVQQRPNKRPI
jgi:spermidine synthase